MAIHITVKAVLLVLDHPESSLNKKLTKRAMIS
jgi:hypothetical protein